MRTRTECLCVELRHAAHTVTRRYDAALAPAGLTVTQFSQMHEIQSLAQPTLKALAESTGLDRSTLGRNVRVMAAQGLVRMEPGTDARTRLVRITEKGHAAYKKAVPLWFEAQRCLVRQLGADGYEVLQSVLDSLTDNDRGREAIANG